MDRNGNRKGQELELERLGTGSVRSGIETVTGMESPRNGNGTVKNLNKNGNGLGKGTVRNRNGTGTSWERKIYTFKIYFKHIGELYFVTILKNISLYNSILLVMI